jgi:hypothetical protein
MTLTNEQERALALAVIERMGTLGRIVREASAQTSAMAKDQLTDLALAAQDMGLREYSDRQPKTVPDPKPADLLPGDALEARDRLIQSLEATGDPILTGHDLQDLSILLEALAG